MRLIPPSNHNADQIKRRGGKGSDYCDDGDDDDDEMDMYKTCGDSIRESQVSEAARNGDVAWLKDLLRHRTLRRGVMLCLNREQTPALVVAAAQGHSDIVKLLLDARDERRRRRVDVDAMESQHQTTALVSAAMGGHASIVAQLLDAGADAQKRHNHEDPRYALTHAVERGHIEVAFMLLEHAKENGHCVDMLMCSCFYKRVATVEFLLRHTDIDVNADHKRSYWKMTQTPLIQAASVGSIALARMLLTRPGIEVNRAIGGGENALSHAFQRTNDGLFSVNGPDLYEMALFLAAHGAVKPTLTHNVSSETPSYKKKILKRCDWAVAASKVALRRFNKWRSQFKLPKTLTDSFMADRALPEGVIEHIAWFAAPNTLWMCEVMRAEEWWNVLLRSRVYPLDHIAGPLDVALDDWLELELQKLKKHRAGEGKREFLKSVQLFKALKRTATV